MITRSKHYYHRAIWALLPAIAVSSWDGNLYGEDAETSELEQILEQENPALRAVSPDGRYLVGWPHALGHRLLVFSLETETKLRRISVDGRALAAEFHPDGQRFAVASAEGNLEYQTTLAVHAVNDDTSRTVGTTMGGITDLAFSPDGERIAAAINLNLLGSIAQEKRDKNADLCVGFVKIWRLEDGEELLSIEMRAPNLRGKIDEILANRKEAESHSQTGGALMNAHYESSRERMPHTLRFSPDGQRLTVVTMSESSAHFDATSGAEIPANGQ